MDYFLSYTFLVVNIIAWVVLLWRHRKKCGFFGAGCLIISTYLFYAIMSLLYYHDSLNTSFSYGELNLFPLIYLFLMLLLAFSPLLKYEKTRVDAIQKPTRQLVDAMSILFIVCTLLSIPLWINQLQTGLVKILLDSAGGLEIYQETMADSKMGAVNDGVISSLPAIISGLLCDLGIVALFYYLTLEKKNKLIIIGLGVSVGILILKEVAYSQRGPVIDRIFAILVAYFFFKRFIPKRINRVVKVIGASIIGFLLLLIAIITVSRFTDEGGVGSSVYAYTGMQNLNFSKYGLDNGGIRYGDRTCAIFKKMLGFSNVPNNFWEGREKYPHLKIDDGVFIGFVGDFTLDFGPFIAPLIFILFNLFVIQNTRIFSKTIKFYQIILLSFVFNVCMEGGMKLYPYAYTDNLRIIVYFMAYFLFRLDYERNYKGKQVFYTYIKE